jgi:hypothetical protein
MAAENLTKWTRFGSDEEKFKNDFSRVTVTSRCDALLAGSSSRLVLLCDLWFAARMFSRLQAARIETISMVIFLFTLAVYSLHLLMSAFCSDIVKVLRQAVPKLAAQRKE